MSAPEWRPPVEGDGHVSYDIDRAGERPGPVPAAERRHLHPEGTLVAIEVLAGCGIDPETDATYVAIAAPGTIGRYLRPSTVVGLDNWHLIAVKVDDVQRLEPSPLPIPDDLTTLIAPLRPDQFRSLEVPRA